MEKATDKAFDRSAGTEAHAAHRGLSLGPSGSILLAVSFAAALWFSFGHDWLSPSFHGPGIGLTVSHLLLAAAAIFTANAISFLIIGVHRARLVTRVTMTAL